MPELKMSRGCIGYHTAERPQTLDEYKDDLESGNAEIEKGNFITNDQLKKDMQSW
jgi:hypothetical protein